MTLFFVILGIILCVALSAYFSGSEMSLSSCNQVRLENEAEKGSKKARRALKLSEHFDDTLSTILIGNNLVNTAASALTTVLIILLTGADVLNWAGTLVVTVLVIIFGETIPKIYGKKNANRFSMNVSGSLTALRILFYPLTLFVVFVTKQVTKLVKEETSGDNEEESVEELQSIIETAEDEGVLDSERSEMVTAAIGFSDKQADEVMTARVDVQAFDINDDRKNIVKMALYSRHSRIPVYEGTIDHIIGIVHLNHLLKAFSLDENTDIREILMEPAYVYKTTKLPQVLDVFKKKRQHLAIVTDEYSGTLGVISFEDVLEQIVGDIWDETDTVEEEVVIVDEDVFRIDGNMAIADFLELIHVREDEFDYESGTAGGFAIEYFGDFPREGDSFVFGDFKITVSSMEERRVTELLLERQESSG